MSNASQSIRHLCHKHGPYVQLIGVPGSDCPMCVNEPTPLIGGVVLPEDTGEDGSINQYWLAKVRELRTDNAELRRANLQFSGTQRISQGFAEQHQARIAELEAENARLRDGNLLARAHANQLKTILEMEARHDTDRAELARLRAAMRGCPGCAEQLALAALDADAAITESDA